MSVIYKNQTPLISLTMDITEDISGATVKQILYKKPHGTSGSWTATLSGKTLSYQTLAGDINESGNWKFQAYIELNDQKIYGSIVNEGIAESLG